MSYLNQAQNPRRRFGALAATIAINGSIGAMIVTGLSFTGLVDGRDYRPIVDFPTHPEPPPPEPTPEKPKQVQDSMVVAPRPPIDGLTENPIDAVVPDEVTDQVVRVIDDGLVPHVPDPPVGQRFTPKSARPANRRERWVTTDDYPRGPLVDGVEGATGYSLVVSSTGQVSACDVTQSSGDRALDQATCKWITKRAKFEPATDESGAKVIGRYSGTVRWEIPD